MTGRVIATIVVVAAVSLVAALGGPLAASRGRDEFASYYYRHLARYAAVLVGVVALIVVWRSAIGHLALFGGLLAAGLAFAMQEVIGSIAGWFNIISGGIYRVGDRVEIAGVKGDVIDITLLRTKVLEMGSSLPEEPSWVGGRQSTGRIVSISNKATFESPTYNYSAFFEFVWEELRVPVPYSADWKRAERIVLEEAERVSDSEGAREAMEQMRERYPVPAHEVDPKVYVTLTDNWVELAARFVIPVRQSRTIKDQMSRSIRNRFDEAGIQVASSTMDVTVFTPTPPDGRSS
ncbi:MAG TPA: mechanosensitive ion channel family protein [Gaiellaceae bacterium]|nr:mechanosensitive ion channel family protein [Gaiellaceae bacterium]